MKEYICYRTKDLEGDIWCEKAFLFECGQDVEKFFTKEKIADLFFEGEIEGVKSIVFHKVSEVKFLSIAEKVQPSNETPYYIEINGGGYNGIEIVEMNKGFFIKSQN